MTSDTIAGHGSTDQPWLLDDEVPWRPGPGYPLPAGFMLLSPHGRRHLVFHEGWWYRLWEHRQAAQISAGHALMLRPLNAEQIVKVSHAWMLHNSASERARALGDELAVGEQELLIRLFRLGGALD